MPFGLATAPEVYNRFIKIPLNHLGTCSVVVYLDDVLVEEHLHQLVEVLEAHLKACAWDQNPWMKAPAVLA